MALRSMPSAPLLFKNVPGGHPRKMGPGQLKRKDSGLNMDDLTARNRSLLRVY